MKIPRVLIISDQQEVAEIWALAVRRRGMDVDVLCMPTEVAQISTQSAYDLCVIDINDNEAEAVPICRDISRKCNCRVLVLTFVSDERFHLTLYNHGVDECVTKPIGTLLFLAKVTAWLRRSPTPQADARNMEYAGFKLDTIEHTLVNPGGKMIRLSNLEYRLLYLLLANKGQVIPTNQLVNQVWQEYDAEGSMLKRLVYRVRSKVEPEPRSPRYIETVNGLGYRFSSG